MEIVISQSTNKTKAYDAVINVSKVISFGDYYYSDFTKHNDPERKALHINRDSNEDWSKYNIASPAWMSICVSWETPTLKGEADDANKTYKDVKFSSK